MNCTIRQGTVKETLAALFDQHHDAVFRHAIRAGASRPSAEDVTVETFWTVAFILNSGQSSGVTGEWLIDIADQILRNATWTYPEVPS